jgi:hypothetical protein
VTGVDGMAAARTLLTYAPVRAGLCLFYVWNAYDAHGADSDRVYGTALDAWNGSPGKHTDGNPPAGVPIYFGARSWGSNPYAGDVVISLGDGLVAATDYPTWGQVGVCTIEQRRAQIGRPYLGWTDNILGYPIALPATEPAAPEPPQRRKRHMLGILVQITGSPDNAPVGARNGDVIFVSPEGSSLVPDPTARDIMQKADAHDPADGPLPLLSIERDILNAQLAACRASGDDQSELLQRVRALGEKLRSAVA